MNLLKHLLDSLKKKKKKKKSETFHAQMPSERLHAPMPPAENLNAPMPDETIYVHVT